ncbi:MAG: hypothetical protein KatS3mg009_1223 [Acidimicrobiia bacterium]|nr:MAG: hypothetical protein KatS3mg009_1223 [Acidimicrobiia bacterium]
MFARILRSSSVLCVLAAALLPATGPAPAAAGTEPPPVVGLASTPDGGGYWSVDARGTVAAFGRARAHGSLAQAPAAPVVGMAATPTGQGYWLVAADGGIFAFGDARFFGSTGGLHLVAPIVGMAATPTGHGYWLVAADGGIFSFGDARFFGSTGGLHLVAPIVGMAATPTGHGYWLVAADGGIFSFGDARFFGSTGGLHLVAPIVGMAATPTGHGYWLVAADGGIFSFGDARFHGSAARWSPGGGARAVHADPSGGGYWIVAGNGAVLAFGDAGYFGNRIGPRPAAPTAALYGDSLGSETAAFFRYLTAAQGVDSYTWTFSGTAACDWIGHAGEDAARRPPRVAVLEFAGNAVTPCMRGPAPEYFARYRRAIEHLVALLSAEGTRVLLTRTPPMPPGESLGRLDPLLRDIADDLAAVDLIDGGAAVAGPGRTWAAGLPCLPFETPLHGCAGGEVPARAPDGVHFCPRPLPPRGMDPWLECGTWNAGAFRFATALADAAVAGAR